MSTSVHFTRASQVVAAFKAHRLPAKAALLQRFFKTAPGEYAHGDIFWGLMVPQTRKIVAQCKELPLSEVEKLLQSPVHEIRLGGLLTLVQRYKKVPKEVYDLYMKNLKYVNNWDLVDLTAHRIIGAEFDRLNKNPLPLLTKLAQSKILWERRVAVLSTFHFINKGQPEFSLKIAELLLHDPHDLIHKAVGWMLREVGKRCSHADEVAFLHKHARSMPRTMLRYAIERFPVKEREFFMGQK